MPPSQFDLSPALDGDLPLDLPVAAGGGDRDDREGAESKAPPEFLRVGAEVEAALPDLGLQGSWYPARVVEVAADASTALVAIPGLLDSSQPDGALRELLTWSRVRPPAPAAPEGFAEGLAVGCLVEVLFQGGWWHSIVKQLPAVAGGGGVAREWTFESLQFGNYHRHLKPKIRPCRRWNASAIGGGSETPDAMDAWTRIELPPEAPSPPVCPPPPPRPVIYPPGAEPMPQTKASNGKANSKSQTKRVSPTQPMPHGVASGVPAASGGKQRAASAGGKRKASSESAPALKGQREQAAQQALRELLEKQYAIGSLVEVRGTEEGFLGSWYGARILEVREGRGGAQLRLCYLAFQEDDGSFWEDWVDHVHVRPMPPDRDDTFIVGLRKGAPLEIFIEEGWWEVELSGRDGTNYLAAAKRYHVEHNVPLQQLRPAWRWNLTDRTWTVHDKPPPPIPKSELVAPRATPKSSGSGGGSKKKKS